jgi:hypothetical protein
LGYLEKAALAAAVKTTAAAHPALAHLQGRSGSSEMLVAPLATQVTGLAAVVEEPPRQEARALQLRPVMGAAAM